MYYTIYKIINKLDGKFYIGMHQTDNLDDDYMGSGNLIRRAIKKHGIENFTKEILFVFDNEEDMKKKEAELVTEELCKSDTCYNICPGGHGGFGYINSNGLAVNLNEQRRRNPEKVLEWASKNAHLGGANTVSQRLAAGLTPYGTKVGDSFRGKIHSEETKLKMSEKAKERIGKKNSQYGTMWITNGNENRKIKKEESIPEGWYKGRSC